jgi:hypothetical protein
MDPHMAMRVTGSFVVGDETLIFEKWVSEDMGGAG